MEMNEFTNPAYEEDLSSENVNKDENENTENDEFADMLAMQGMLDDLMVQTKESELDLHKLNNKRTKSNISAGFNQSSSSSSNSIVKVGSLKGSGERFVAEEIILVLHDILDGENELESDTSTRALLDYFAHLGNPESKEDADFFFLDALLVRADGNLRDDFGQTLMHEVARDWHTDFAYFLKLKGINIDQEDLWGRTPLFVAVTSNNTEMVKWLIKNGAKANHRTMKGEGQTPIHYAGKYDAVEAFDALVELGANPLERDYHNKTPFFVAAEAGNTRICAHFLDMELPTACYASSGVSTIDQIIENLPKELALRALNQFFGESPENKNKVGIYLSCLGKRRLILLGKNPSNHSGLINVTPPDALEIITRKGDLTLISHPVVLQLLKLKNEKFASKYILLNVFLYLLFTLLWTLSVSFRVADIETGSSTSKTQKIGILVVTMAAQMLTFLFIYKVYIEWKLEEVYMREQKMRLQRECEASKVFCHPRWIGDKDTLAKKIEAIKLMRANLWRDGWIYVEMLCLLLSCISTIITIVWYIQEEESTLIQQVRIYYSAFFILIVWLRQNKCLRFHQSFGPFIAILGQCVYAFAQIGFLFFEFFIPFAISFWVLFGQKTVDGSDDNEYFKFSDVLYQVWLMSMIGDYDYSTLQSIDEGFSKIFLGAYFLLVSIITINMYIALLSEAFARVSETASAGSYLEESIQICNIEKLFPEHKRDFEKYINKYCAPLMMERSEFEPGTTEENTRSVLSKSVHTVMRINRLMQKIAENEATVKQDLSHIEEKFHDFGKRHSQDSVEQTLKTFESFMSYQSQPFAKMAKSTNKIVNFLKQKSKMI